MIHTYTAVVLFAFSSSPSSDHFHFGSCVFTRDIRAYASSHYSLDKWNGNFLTLKMLCVYVSKLPKHQQTSLAYHLLLLLCTLFASNNIRIRLFGHHGASRFYLSTKLLPVQHQYRVLSIAAPHCLPVIETIQYIWWKTKQFHFVFLLFFFNVCFVSHSFDSIFNSKFMKMEMRAKTTHSLFYFLFGFFFVDFS